MVLWNRHLVDYRKVLIIVLTDRCNSTISDCTGVPAVLLSRPRGGPYYMSFSNLWPIFWWLLVMMAHIMIAPSEAPYRPKLTRQVTLCFSVSWGKSTTVRSPMRQKITFYRLKSLMWKLGKWWKWQAGCLSAGGICVWVLMTDFPVFGHWSFAVVLSLVPASPLGTLTTPVGIFHYLLWMNLSSLHTLFQH